MKILTLLAFTLFTSLSFAFNPPTLSRPVHDETNTLSAETLSKLEAAIRSVYKDGQGPQLAVLIVPSLNGGDVKAVANEVFTKWGLGNKDRDDGVLFLISLKDRRTRIEVGQGLEGTLTDQKSKRIIDQAVIPFFKKGDYNSGIAAGTKEILQVMIQPNAVQQPAQVSTHQTQPVNGTVTSNPQDDGETETILGGIVVVSILVGLTLWLVYSAIYFNVQRKDLNEMKALVAETERVENSTLEASINKCKMMNDQIDAEGDKLERLVNSLTSQKSSSPQGLLEKSKERLRNQISSTRALVSETDSLKRLSKGDR